MNKEAFKRQLRILRRKKWPAALAILLVIALIAAPIVSYLQKDYSRFAVKSPQAFSKLFLFKKEREEIHLIAHRGFSAQAPENTVPAVQKAGEYGFDTVEFDVRQTQDGVWVVSHDADVKSMTDKKGKISSFTYYDLVTCTIGNGANHEKYDNLKIPTLDQMLKSCLENNVRPMIEIKDYTESGIKTLLETVDKNGFTESCSIISFDREALELVRKVNPDIRLYALVQKLDKKEMENCLADTSIGVSFNGSQKANTKDKIQKLVDADVPLVCWTADSKEMIEKYYKMGVTDFVTNKIYPR